MRASQIAARLTLAIPLGVLVLAFPTLVNAYWLTVAILALFYAILYLAVLRKRFPPVAASLPVATWDPYGPAAADRPPPLPAAAWFTDPSGRPGERWWDGRGWTDLVRPADRA